MAVIRLRSRMHIWRHRTYNRWADLRARAAGYCNHAPWHPIPGQGGGYAHWRCALRAGHTGVHRSRNYVWDRTGRTTYRPLPAGQNLPDQPWRRSMTPTAAQERARGRWLDEQLSARAVHRTRNAS
ncbi:hypothetical protein OOJ91_34025 [Micromonospora lupini]|uniref:hypothetical protein n=1 Tax=Micromonospora lupini TaxID=285679 RepID=UPI0022552A16|nr:hypothetical protein [Micromonospora lupini]MCX5070867.1 hypothetical protein [Micromonospora lupini]